MLFRSRRVAFTIFDWHANCVVDGNTYVPMPGNYYTESKWREVFSATGFDVKEEHYIGVYKKKFSNLPHSVFVLKKKKDFSSSPVNRINTRDFIAELEKRARQAGYAVDAGTKFSLLVGGNVKTSPSFRIFNYLLRSEERRVGKECRSRWSPYH